MICACVNLLFLVNFTQASSITWLLSPLFSQSEKLWITEGYVLHCFIVVIYFFSWACQLPDMSGIAPTQCIINKEI